jgi:hypothetical protein
MGHPVPQSRPLVWPVSVFLWAGDLQSADGHTDWLISHAESHSLGPYLAVGRGYTGTPSIHRGEPKSGVEILQGCLEVLHAARYELLTTAFNVFLVQGLAAIGQVAAGMAPIDETIGLVEANGDFCYMPELLRVKGLLFRSMPQPHVDDAELLLMQSLELRRRCGARAWELRTATDLAALFANQGRSESGRALLQPVFEQFTEGLTWQI